MEKEVLTDKDKAKFFDESLKREAESMLTNTSCLAIGNIFIRNHPLLKILWSLAFIICSIVAIKQLYGLSNQYFSYPLNTIIKGHTTTYKFPSITFCNLNPLRKNMVYLGKPELQKFFNELKNKNFTVDNMNEMSSRLQDESKFLKLILNETSEVRKQMGHQLTDFILQCNFLGKTCNLQKLFKTFLSNKFGNCFTFNPTISDILEGRIDRQIRRNGLFITFYVQYNEYLTNFVPSTGIRIHLHETNSLESPGIYGMTLPTGFHITVCIVPTKIRLLDINENCEKGKLFRNKYKSNYTVQSCYDVCFHEFIYKTCRCYDTTFQLYLNNVSNFVCNTEKEINCLLKTLSQFDHLRQKCKCKEACSSTSYRIEQSFATWPDTAYEKRFFDDMGDVYPKFINIVKSHKYQARKNFTNVIIYIKDNFYNEIYQVRAYEWESFMSEIGGTLSLFLGFSILTAFEFLESVTLLFSYMCSRFIYREVE